MKLSTVILAKNEEKQLGRAIETVEFSSEVIVIDDFSIDKTTEIAKEMGAIVYQRALNGDFSAQRNFGLKKSRGDWILFLDADEFLSKELQEEIREIINNATKYGAFYIKRRDHMWGSELKYGELRKLRNKGLIRLIKKNSGKWSAPVHETFLTFSTIGQLDSHINHFPHQSVRDFLEEINFYSSLRAKELFQLGIKPSLLAIVIFPTGKFLLNYFLRLGFLDGPAGFLYAFMMSFHSFLVRAKLYQYVKLSTQRET